MDVQAILRSRSLTKDYGWKCWPDYLSQNLQRRLSFIQALLARSDLTAYARQESRDNYYFLYDESGCALVHGFYTNSTDKVGRQIFTVEGLACPALKMRIFWYALPYLIDCLSLRTSIRDTLKGMMDNERPLSHTLTISELEEDHVLLDQDHPDSLWHRLREPSGKMALLWQDVHRAPDMYAFVYGTREKSFYPEGFERFYTDPELAALPPLPMQEAPPCPVPVIEAERNKFRVIVETEKRKNGYAAHMDVVDREGEHIASTLDINITDKGVSIAQLEELQLAIRNVLGEFGYGKGDA